MGNTGPPKSFILDFDGTITRKDTIDILFKSALAVQNAKGNDMTRTWEDIVTSYDRDYQTHVRAYEPAENERDTVEQEAAFYRSLRAVEEKSFERISNSGIFVGISEQDWEELGSDAVRNGEVLLREGFEIFLDGIKISKARWSVVSVNFSSAFIRGVLGSRVEPDSSVLILANQPDKNGVLTGLRISEGTSGKVMTTSDGKLTCVQGLIGSWDPSKVVYIGDSGTDIECLLSDGVIGIIMSSDGRSSLMRTMSRIGMEVLHIGKYEETKTIYWARDYLEIVQSPLLK